MSDIPRTQADATGAAPEGGATVSSPANGSRPARGRPSLGWLGTDRAFHYFLLTLVFIAGMVSLGIEMCGPRLMAPYFGTSLFIWANQIGFTLLYLSIGYWIGGRLADRYPSTRVLCALTAVAALATGIIPFISKPVLDWSVSGLTTANASVFLSSMLAVILLFSVPTILLGMVSPFAIRLTMDRIGNAGTRAGSLYALSTVGSIIGAFLPVLVLIPAWGVRRTLFAACVVLLAASIWGLLPRERLLVSTPGGLLLLPLLLPQIFSFGALKPQQFMIYDQESLYNYIQVFQYPNGVRTLVLNEGLATHSIYYPDRVLTGDYWDYYLAMPFFNGLNAPKQLKRVAIVGLAGGTIARELAAAYGPVPIDGAEIDPAIIDVARNYFHMTEPNLHPYAGDGRTFMRTTPYTYDLVAVDAFHQPYIPFQLTTREFFQEIKAHLSPQGVLVLNTAHVGSDYRLVQAFVNTLYQVFPSVYLFDVPSDGGSTFANTEIVATMHPSSLTAFHDTLRQVPGDSLLGSVAEEVLPTGRDAKAQPGGVVFTDDHAPIEQLTDQLILSYLQGK
jgi:spermidine synthase